MRFLKTSTRIRKWTGLIKSVMKRLNHSNSSDSNSNSNSDSNSNDANSNSAPKPQTNCNTTILSSSPPLPEAPDFCCQSGCQRCSWTVYHEELIEYERQTGKKADLPETLDPGLRLFLETFEGEKKPPK